MSSLGGLSRHHEPPGGEELGSFHSTINAEARVVRVSWRMPLVAKLLICKHYRTVLRGGVASGLGYLLIMALYTWLDGIRPTSGIYWYHVEAESAHLQIEAATRKSKNASGFRDVTAGALERRRDELALYTLDGRRQVTR